MRFFLESAHIHPTTNMRSSRKHSLEAFMAKMSHDDVKANRAMGHATAPKGAHAGKEVPNHSRPHAAGHGHSAR